MLLSVLRLGCAIAALVRARFVTAQVAWHLAIVDPLLVARLAAEPLLGGAGRLHVARFALGALPQVAAEGRHPLVERQCVLVGVFGVRAHLGGAGTADEWWSTIFQSLPSFT